MAQLFSSSKENKKDLNPGISLDEKLDALEKIGSHDDDGETDRLPPMARDVALPQMISSYKTLLSSVGENCNREGLLKTPERAAKAFLFFTKGYEERVSGQWILVQVVE